MMPLPQHPKPSFIGSHHTISVPKQEFLSDSRIEPIWDRLMKEMKLPEDTMFATSIDPQGWVYDDQGITYLQPERVIFWAVAANPQPRWKGKFIKEYAIMDINEWRQMEMQRWRYVNAPDPAYLILKELSRRLVKEYQNWKEMN